MFIDYTEFKQKPENFKFDKEKNIKRLLIQQNGDFACYYLAIIAFIEGYLRYKLNKPYNDNYWSEKLYINDLLGLYQNNLEEHTPEYNLMSQIKFFATRDSFKPEDGPKIYYSSANRIRHSFASIEKNEIAALIGVFIRFSKYFKFYNNDIASLLNNKKIFKNQLNQTVDKDSQETQDEIFKLSKNLNDKLKKNPNYIKLLQSYDNTDINNLSDEMLDFLSQRENLKLNQYKLAEYSRSWRNYQLDASKFTEDQVLIKNTIINSIINGKKQNYVVLGGPGTGKTILLLDLLQNIINLTKDNNFDVELLTYTNSLNKYNRFLAKSLSFSERCDIHALTSRINTFDDFILKKAEKLLNRKIFRINNESDFEDTDSKNILGMLKLSNNFKYSASFVLKEAINEIWSMRPTKEQYVNGDFRKNNELLSIEAKQARETVWTIIKDLEFSLDHESADTPILYEYACYKLSDMEIPTEYKIDYLLVDEAQDLTSTKLCLISKFTKKNYILSGDLAQSIFIKQGFSWTALNQELIKTGDADFIDLHLTKNFRSTEPIQNLAYELFNSNDFCIKLKDVYSEGFMPGPMPTYTITPSLDTAITSIVRDIIDLKKNTMSINRDICVLAANNDELKAVQKALDEIPSSFINQEDFKFEDDYDTVKLSTVQNIKGIDCTTVFLLISNNYINKKSNGNLDYYAQLNSLYASITRAMNWLKVYIANEDNLIDKSDTVIPILLDTLHKKAIEDPFINKDIKLLD